MPSDIDGLRLRRVMGKDHWLAPKPYGPNGWGMRARGGEESVIVTVADWPDDPGRQWIHASMTRPGGVPSYTDLVQLHRAAFAPHAYAYQAFVPAADHVNIHERALHLVGAPRRCPDHPRLWGRGVDLMSTVEHRVHVTCSTCLTVIDIADLIAGHLEQMAAYYPAEIFLEHGTTSDSVAGTALRVVLTHEAMRLRGDIA